VPLLVTVPQVNCSGQWNVEAMRASLYAMRNATLLDKKTLCVHAVPGPAGTPLVTVNGTGTTHPSPPHNSMVRTTCVVW